MNILVFCDYSFNMDQELNTQEGNTLFIKGLPVSLTADVFSSVLLLIVSFLMVSL